MIEVRREEDVAAAREAVRELSAELGLSRVTREKLASIASELAHNAVRHAGSGTVHLSPLERDGVHGVEIEVRDRGPGIGDLTAALTGGGSTAGGLGMGLSAARRMADELDIDTRRYEGTRLWARAFDAPVHAWPQFALVGRPHPDEIVSGDDGLIFSDGREVLFAVADGLGHGAEARESARRSMDALRAHTHQDLGTLLHSAHDAVLGTRGAALTVGRYGALSGELHVCGVGNVMAEVHGPGGRRRQHRPRSGTLGSRPSPRPPSPALAERVRGEILVVYSDGLRSTLKVPDKLLWQPAAVIAHQLLMTFWRERDDGTVLVVK